MNRFGAGAMAASLLAGGALWLPGPGAPTLCPLRLLTGLPCPTCGLGHSVCLTLHGQLEAAWLENPVGPALVLVAALVLFASALGESPLERLRSLATPAFAVGLVAETLTSWPRHLQGALAEGWTSALSAGHLTRPLIELFHGL